MAQKHRVINIGALFTDKDIAKLAEVLDNQAAAGYHLVQVFSVIRKAGCLGQQAATNLAVFVNDTPEEPSK